MLRTLLAREGRCWMGGGACRVPEGEMREQRTVRKELWGGREEERGQQLCR